MISSTAFAAMAFVSGLFTLAAFVVDIRLTLSCLNHRRGLNRQLSATLYVVPLVRGHVEPDLSIEALHNFLAGPIHAVVLAFLSCRAPRLRHWHRHCLFHRAGAGWCPHLSTVWREVGIFLSLVPLALLGPALKFVQIGPNELIKPAPYCARLYLLVGILVEVLPKDRG